MLIRTPGPAPFPSRSFRTIATRLIASVVSVFLFSSGVAAGLPELSIPADKAAPTVVHIHVISEEENKKEQPALDGVAPNIREWMERMMRRPDRAGAGVPMHQAGSGVIVSDDGHILTIAGVVHAERKMEVVLKDQRRFEAKLLGVDEHNGIAVLKITADDLPFARAADEMTPVGGWVFAAGAPRPGAFVVSVGVISDEAALREGHDKSITYLSSDTNIGTEWEGGPLFDAQGSLIGINLYAGAGSKGGMPLALPVAVAMDSYRQIIEKGSVSRGWLGVGIQEVTPELARSFSLDHPRGALITEVIPGGPAEEAGLRAGDILIRVAKSDISHVSELPRRVGVMRPGTSVRVAWIRDGKEQSKILTIGTHPASSLAIAGKGRRPSGEASLGLHLADLTEHDRASLADGGYKSADAGGARVLKVEEGSGRQAGILPDDILLELDNRKIKDVASLRRMLDAASDNKPLPILLWRKGRLLFLAIKP